MRTFFKLPLVLAALALPLCGKAVDIYFGETDMQGPGGRNATTLLFLGLLAIAWVQYHRRQVRENIFAKVPVKRRNDRIRGR